MRKCAHCGMSLAHRRHGTKYCSGRCRRIACNIRAGGTVKPADMAYADNCKYFDKVYVYDGRFRCVNWKGHLCEARSGICSWNKPKEELK